MSEAIAVIGLYLVIGVAIVRPMHKEALRHASSFFPLDFEIPRYFGPLTLILSAFAWPVCAGIWVSAFVKRLWTLLRNRKN